MKRINSNIVTIFLLLLTTSTSVFASGAKLPDIALGGDPNSTIGTDGGLIANPPSSPPLPPSTLSGPYVDQIKLMARSSACANINWSGRGKAPVGYILGMSLSYARSLCRYKTNTAISKIMSGASSGNAAKDALTIYLSTFQAIPISVTTAGLEPLRAVYTLGIGLGMRESSGRYCEGLDKAAGLGRPASAIEAGIFQTSQDSMVASPELQKLFNEYKAHPEKCYLDVFKKGVSCGANNIIGSGVGAEFQKLSLTCPAFAAEYAMTLLRILRGHYGPINRKEAQVAPACNQLLKVVQSLINNDAYACEDLI